jgi:hypothetical protein
MINEKIIFDYVLVAEANEREKNYDVYDIKFLIIMKTYKKWQYYFEEIQYIIEIVCNYQNLKYFIIAKALNRRQIV